MNPILTRRVLATIASSLVPIPTAALVAAVEDGRPAIVRRVWVVLRALQFAGWVREVAGAWVATGRRGT